jgi:dethiobiotin synthetase
VPGRPARLVVVTGTGTEVGKTWVGAALLSAARQRGLTVAARKPLQSFSPGDHSPDSVVLAQASGQPEAAVCAEERSYAAPMAPPMAAEALGRPVPTIEQLAADVEASWPPGGCDLGLVEGAGGVVSPLGADGHTADLARRLAADLVVLVSDASLGVINLVRLGAAAVTPLPLVVHLNRFHPGVDLHRRNAAWLAERDGFEVTTTVEDLLDRLIGG